MRTYTGSVPNKLLPHQFYVFPSNTEGRHGKGAALVAKMHHGALQHQSAGKQGNSYAIVTKNLRAKTHPSISAEFITFQIKLLLAGAKEDEEYFIAYRDDGKSLLSGYSIREMAAIFAGALHCEIDEREPRTEFPDNFYFEEGFARLIVEETERIHKTKL